MYNKRVDNVQKVRILRAKNFSYEAKFYENMLRKKERNNIINNIIKKRRKM